MTDLQRADRNDGLVDLSLPFGERRSRPPRCLFCAPAAISPSQLLMTTEHFYLLAPVGQVVEGYLFIATHICRDEPQRLRCMTDVPEGWNDELASVIQMVRDFYGEVYGTPALFYEHGRGGGTQSSFTDEDYAFHPHLCALPGRFGAHRMLDGLLASGPCDGLAGIRQVVGTQPYLYAHDTADEVHPEPIVYWSADGDCEGVNRLRFKRLLAGANGLGERWDWRTYPGIEERDALIGKFTQWYEERFEHY